MFSWKLNPQKSGVALPFRTFLHPKQLMSPQSLECGGPLVQRLDRVGVHSIQHPASVAPDCYQPNLQQHTQMLRYGRLLDTQTRRNVADRTLLDSKIVQYLPAAGLGDGIKSIGGCGRSRHLEDNIYLYGNMSRGEFRNFWRVEIRDYGKT